MTIRSDGPAGDLSDAQDHKMWELFQAWHVHESGDRETEPGTDIMDPDRETTMVDLIADLLSFADCLPPEDHTISRVPIGDDEPIHSDTIGAQILNRAWHCYINERSTFRQEAEGNDHHRNRRCTPQPWAGR